MFLVSRHRPGAPGARWPQSRTRRSGPARASRGRRRGARRLPRAAEQAADRRGQRRPVSPCAAGSAAETGRPSVLGGEPERRGEPSHRVRFRHRPQDQAGPSAARSPSRRPPSGAGAPAARRGARAQPAPAARRRRRSRTTAPAPQTDHSPPPHPATARGGSTGPARGAAPARAGPRCRRRWAAAGGGTRVAPWAWRACTRRRRAARESEH